MITRHVSNRLGPGQSEIRRMTQRCNAIGGLNLGQGLCQIPPPRELLVLAAEQIRSTNHSYSPAEGSAAFRRAVAAKIARYDRLSLDPESEILVTIGATGAFNATLMALLNPGDGVLLIEPFYGYHLSAVRLLGLMPQTVALEEGSWELTCRALEEAVTAETRAVVVCTPANPSGRRYTHGELEVVERVADEHDLLVITDEVYEHIYFGVEPHLSPARVGSLFDRTISISSLSKTFSIPGWRLGYAAGPARLLRHVRLAADTLVVCAPAPLQEIAASALEIGEDYYIELRRVYEEKLRMLTLAFEVHGCSVLRPEGSYYALVDLGDLGVRTGTEAAALLLDKCGIATIPYEAFQLSGEPRPLVRACFSLPDDDLYLLEEKLGSL